MAPTGVASERLTIMAEAEVPIVLLDRSTPGLDAPLVQVDNEDGGYQATRYLLALGHRRIGVLRGLETISTLVVRVNGYRRALAEAGIPIDEALIVRADPHYHSNQTEPSLNGAGAPPTFLTNLQMTPTAFNALQQLLDLPDRPTAIFITNNQMTLGALHALKQRGLNCPDDISVICFDDHDWAPLFSPPLTVIRQPTYHLGKTAATLLMEMINQKKPVEPPAPLPVELVVRESCRRLT
jgi:LacI family transcriptional regulator